MSSCSFCYPFKIVGVLFFLFRLRYKIYKVKIIFIVIIIYHYAKLFCKIIFLWCLKQIKLYQIDRLCHNDLK